MKIAVAAQAAGMASEVDPRFGRAPWFIIYDTEEKSSKDINNSTNQAQAHGAGTGSADTILREKVDTVVAGRFGPKAEAVFQAAGVNIVSWSGGTVEQAVQFVCGQQTDG